MSRILYFDLETKYAADEVGGWNNVWDMGMSVGVVWDTLKQDFSVYLEHQAAALANHLRQADLVVGFNHVEFDYKVVAGSQPTPEGRHRLYLELMGLHNFDMLAELKKILNHRLKLDSIARPTLQEGKSADGLQALEWYKQGRIDLIIAYCKQDVDVTRRIYEYAVEKGHLLYESRSGIKTVQLSWTAPTLAPKPATNPGEQLSLLE